MAGRLFTGLRGWRAVGFGFAALIALLSSAFAGVLIVSAMNPDQIEVRVFLDEAGDHLLDGVVGDALNPGLPAVDVLIFRDDGPIVGQADIGDTKVGPTYTTDANGVVLVSGLNTAEQYWIAVDSRTIDPPTGSSGGGMGWVAEQTYGPAGSMDATGGVTAAAGPLYGGRDPVNNDNALDAEKSDHIALMSPGGPVAEFGFSFNVVTSTRSNEYQGSFQQFLQNANDIEGPNRMRFVPAVPVNGFTGSASYWVVDPNKVEMLVNDDLTVVDGTAFAPGGGLLDPNPGPVSVNGGQPVGARGVLLPVVQRPELQIFESSFRLELGDGNLPNGAEIRDVHILAVDNVTPPIGVFGTSGGPISDVVVSGVVIGTANPTDLTAAPAVNQPSFAVTSDFSPGVVVENSYIGGTNSDFVRLDNSAAPIVRGNEMVTAGLDGLNLLPLSPGSQVTGNRMVGVLEFCVDSFSLDAVISDNTFNDCGDSIGQSGGVRVGDRTAVVEFNLFEQNKGPGVVVAGENTAQGRAAARAVISQNSFVDNDAIAIDNHVASTDNALNGDGITVNDGTTTPTAGNAFLDYPVLTGLSDAGGGNVNVLGTACAGCTVEIFTAVGAANDIEPISGATHGEGVMFLGSAVAGPGGAFSIAIDPTGVTEISATATDGALRATSEFSPNFSIAIIGGRVLLDPNGDATLGDAVAVAGATVRVYEDLALGGGQELPQATDPLVATLTTDAMGGWIMPNASASSYWIAVDSRTIAPATLNPGTDAGYAWAEQTYGPTGSLRSDGAGGTETTTTAGPVVAGKTGSGSDDATALLSSEHVFRVDGSSPQLGLDTAFSFNVVTTTAGGGAADFDLANVRSQQGTLRQFIRNAEAISGPNVMRFVPAVPVNAGGGGRTWWRSSVTVQLPDLQPAGTAIDGQAYDFTQPTVMVDPSVGDVLPAIGAGGKGVNVSPVDVPELELWGDRSLDPGMDGFRMRGDSSSVRNVAFIGFRAAINVDDGPLGPTTGFAVEGNAFGFDMATLGDPGSANRLQNGVNTNGGSGLVVRGNAFGYSKEAALDVLTGADGYLIEMNRFVSPSVERADTDAITIFGGLIGTVQHNHILNSPAFGIDVYRTAAPVMVLENTVDGFGSGGVEEGAIRIFGTGSTVTGNLLTNGVGSPIVVVGDSSLGPAVVGRPGLQALIVDNVYGAFVDFPGGPAATAVDLVGPDLGEFGTEFGDGPTANSGTPGTDCGYQPLYGNDGIDYPVILVKRVGATWEVTGQGCPDATVRLYASDALGGQPTFPVATVPVSAAGVINSVVPISAPAAVAADYVAAAQVHTRNTSEFAPAVEITGNVPPTVVNPGPQSATEFSLFSIIVAGNDPDDAPLVWSVSSAEPGIIIDSVSGEITWTPGEAHGGTTVPVTVSLTAGGVTVSEMFDITVAEFDNPPTITNPGPQTATESIPFSLTVVGDDPDSPFTWSLDSAPPGMAIDPSSGEITWTPGETDGGTTPTVAVRITSGPASASTSFVISVAEAESPPVIVDPGPQTATEFSPFTLLMSGSDADLPAQTLSWSVVSGPAGFTIDPTTGLVGWTPSEAHGGTIQTAVIGLTTGAQTVTQSVSISVTEDDQVPVVTAPPVASATTGVLFSAMPTAVDPDTPAVPLTWSLGGPGGIPPGMSIDPTSGLISYTAPAAGPFTVDIVATQPNALSGRATWTGVVTDPVGPPPVLSAPPNQTITEGQTASLAFTATNAVTYSLISGPAGASINPTTGLVTWATTETDGGSAVVFTVQAGGPGGSDSGSATVSVSENNLAPTIAPIADRTVTLGDRLVVALSAADADRPLQTLTFSVVSGPAGLIVDNVNDRVIWPDASSLGTFPVVVRVSDDGSPSRSADASFSITVQLPPTTTTRPPSTTAPATSSSSSTSSSTTATTALSTTTTTSAPATTSTPPTSEAPQTVRPELPIDNEVLLVMVPELNSPLQEPYEPTLSLTSGIPGLLSAPGSFEIPPTVVGLAGAWILVLGIPLVLWERKRAVSVVAGVDADETLPVYATRNSTYPFAHLRPSASMLWSRYRFFGLGEGLRVKIESPVGPVWVERKHLRPLHEPIADRDSRI
ncbi:MAG: hypothetical protein HKN03_15700 [Acidimicrobiales bacterium]|nr:hypothetical protein [Acidimicrobiales bacterium]